jgi:predicted lipoprotein with Yx(FWY)xxD motif
MYNQLTRKTMKATLTIAAFALCFSQLAVAGPTTWKDGVMRDSSGRTVYVFSKDEAGVSHCSGDCTKMWPPFLAKDGAQAAEEMTLVVREGGKQWAMKGQPLYHFAGDTVVGEAKGDGMGGTWRVVRSNPASAKTSPPSSYSY